MSARDSYEKHEASGFPEASLRERGGGYSALV